MNTENSNSGSNTATMSSSDSRKPADSKMGESEFLNRQAEEAKAAMAQVASEMKEWFAKGVDPVAWAKRHPWVGIGIGAVAGFATAALVVPSKEQQALNRLARIEAALHPHRPAPPEDGAAPGKQKQKEHGLLATVLKEVLGALGPTLSAMVSSTVTQGMNNPPTPAPNPNPPVSSS